jgi:hypothetical protein
VSAAAGQHWFCSACGTFDGPRTEALCDVCMDGSEVERLVLADTVIAAVFDALSWMDPETAGKWRAEPTYKRLRAALETAGES